MAQESSNDMPVSLTLLDWDNELVVTDSWSDLKKVLDQLPRLVQTPNTIANLVHPTAGTLSIGIAGAGDKDNPSLSEPVACINYTSKSNDPPYLSVVGDPHMSVKSNGIVVFRYEGGTWTEIPRRNCVPVSRMLEIARHFAFHAGLPNWVGWEEL